MRKSKQRRTAPLISIETLRSQGPRTPQKPSDPPSRVVRQNDLENIITLRAQIKRLERNAYLIEHGVIENLAAGAEVEDGRRTAELLSKFEDGEQIHWIEVN